jgi:hypothetical protein
MNNEDTIRQFTAQGYRVVVLGAGAGPEDFKREVAQAVQHGQKTVLLVDDESNIRVEAGRIVLDCFTHTAYTRLDAFDLEDIKPVQIVSPLRIEEVKREVRDDYQRLTKGEYMKAKQDFRYRSKHFKKL